MNFLFVVNDLNISSSGDITIYHRKATWLGPLNRVVKQFLVSILSHLTNPFCRIQKGALKKYFISIYTQSSFDDLLFDGKDGRYFDKIQDVYRLHDIKKSNLIDIGCGDATFYYWLKSIRSIPITYLGIDVAHPSQTINNSAKIVNLDVIDYSLKNKSIQPSLLMMSNSICYMDVLSQQYYRSCNSHWHTGHNYGGNRQKEIDVTPRPIRIQPPLPVLNK